MRRIVTGAAAVFSLAAMFVSFGFGQTSATSSLSGAVVDPSGAVIPGASKPERIAEDVAAMKVKVPAEFWRELREQQLVSPLAPLPIDSK